MPSPSVYDMLDKFLKTNPNSTSSRELTSPTIKKRKQQTLRQLLETSRKNQVPQCVDLTNVASSDNEEDSDGGILFLE